MNIINLQHRKDFGDDWYVQILNTGRHVPKFMKNYSLIQLSVSWNDYPSWPYIQIKSGAGCLFSILFWAYKFGLDVDLLGNTWRWNYDEEIELD